VRNPGIDPRALARFATADYNNSDLFSRARLESALVVRFSGVVVGGSSNSGEESKARIDNESFCNPPTKVLELRVESGGLKMATRTKTTGTKRLLTDEQIQTAMSKAFPMPSKKRSTRKGSGRFLTNEQIQAAMVAAFPMAAKA
jgi:hypothetical protein